MKVVIDISPGLLKRLRRAVESGGFASLGQFATLALENQLSLEGASRDSVAHAETVESPTAERQPPDPSTAGFAALSVAGPVSGPIFDSSSAARLNVEEYGWIWGIVNRILPIKVALRSLLSDSALRAFALESARTRAGQRAEEIAKWILKRYAGNEPSRDESLLTGLPTREPLYKARERFEDHFFGRIDKAGQAWGALFELGLAGVDTSDGRHVVALTTAGVTLASLPNPVLDEGRLDQSMSDKEIEAYLDLVASQVPRERSCFLAILENLSRGEMTVEQLDELTKRILPRRFSVAAAQTMKAGALGRMQDLRLATRIRMGRSARFAITQRGESALHQLARTQPKSPEVLAAPASQANIE